MIFVLALAHVPSNGQSRKDSLLVFVGEKIEVELVVEEEEPSIETVIRGTDTIQTRTVTFKIDNEYRAKYKILQKVHGFYDADTIEFTVFDHYGKPAFSQYQHVLLFVSYHDGELYHEKYQYYAVYLTTDHRWASPYAVRDYNHAFKDEITVKPEKISFATELSFPLDQLQGEVQRRYPRPYFEVKNGRAFAVYGNYIEELFQLKKETILKARGIY